MFNHQKFNSSAKAHKHEFNLFESIGNAYNGLWNAIYAFIDALPRTLILVGSLIYAYFFMRMGSREALIGGLFLGLTLYRILQNFYWEHWKLPFDEEKFPSMEIPSWTAILGGAVAAMIALTQNNHVAGIVGGILLAWPAGWTLFILARIFSVSEY